MPLRPDLDGAGTMNGKRLAIRDDVSAATLRRLARREPGRAAAARMSAIADAMEGMTRAEAARLAGMERQALRDAVVRCNAEGLAGLHDRPRPGSKPRLDEARRAALRQLVLDGPEVEATGVSAWTLAELRHEAEARWGVRRHEGHMSKLVRALGLSRQKARPSHPKADPAAREAFAKGGSKAGVLPIKPDTRQGWTTGQR
ncbi:hypothetical protein GCM10009416_08650 [Craurococcus roseus]|uniref:Winged helix-turn helix domain-containing protein n=1 Tax=Craurococcus roseus TaxID=77585 RepID=A0ABN1EQY7_9PROT